MRQERVVGRSWRRASSHAWRVATRSSGCKASSHRQFCAAAGCCPVYSHQAEREPWSGLAPLALQRSGTVGLPSMNSLSFAFLPHSCPHRPGEHTERLTSDSAVQSSVTWHRILLPEGNSCFHLLSS